ncbi:MAG TPA: ABC transporter permease [Bryobacteraceae bacterium]|nr:ABC transporter permease [Bryobacteraceae bacterium]
MRWKRRGERERELERELRDHLELEVEEQRDAGLPPEEARYAARRALGNAAVVKEEVRDMWRWTAIGRLGRDLRYGVRLMRRSPGFSIVAVATLAMGIGANTAIFSVVNAVLLEPLPFPEPERLVRVWESMPARDQHRNVVNGVNFLDWRERTRSFAAMAAMTDLPANLTGDGEPEALPGMQVSPEFFQVLGISPVIGRGFTAEEGIPGKDDRAVLSYGLWQRRFGGDRNILGRKIGINGAPVTVVGVMPRGFTLPDMRAEVWTPLPIVRNKDWEGGRFLSVIARLKPGMSLERARADVAGVAKQTSEERPAMNKNWSAEVFPLLEDVTLDVRLPLVVLLAAVAFVLLIACANVANLLLMRAAGRLREIAVRAALGAGRRRILQQLLAESLLLALAGCAVGLAVAYWGLKGLIAMIPANTPLPRMEAIHLDARVFVFALAVSAVTAVIFGLAPAVQISRLELQDALKQGSLRTGVGGNRRFRREFVIAEVALALVLLTGAGLMVRSFLRLLAVNPGFAPERVLTMSLFVSPSRYADDGKRSRYFEQILAEIRNVPGVQAAGSVHFLPLTGKMSGSCFARADEPPPTTSSPGAQFLVISSGYFQAIGMRMLQGRSFGERDGFDSPNALVVNHAFAERFFHGENSIGQRLNVCWSLKGSAEIVGVVADARQTELQAAPMPTIFVSNAQAPMYFADLVVRARRDPRQLTRAVEAAVHRVDRDQAIPEVKTMEEVLSDSVAQPRFQLVLLAVFAGIAVLLATVGVYGVISYSVSQRTQEIGIRVAMGANAGEIAGLVLREGLLLAGAGLAIGLGGAVALTRVMRSLLFEVTPTDPVTLGLAGCALLAVAALAMVVPARRAARVDPTVALRYE